MTAERTKQIMFLRILGHRQASLASTLHMGFPTCFFDTVKSLTIYLPGRKHCDLSYFHGSWRTKYTLTNAMIAQNLFQKDNEETCSARRLNTNWGNLTQCPDLGRVQIRSPLPHSTLQYMTISWFLNTRPANMFCVFFIILCASVWWKLLPDIRKSALLMSSAFDDT
jgi:hypothetical protein